MTRPFIQVEGLMVGWDTTVLLEGASFHVDRGEVFGILGVSGCGKSTLMRYLVGLEAPGAGTVTIEGIGQPRPSVGRPSYGMAFQAGALFSSMTVGENLALALEEWTSLPRDAVRAIVEAKLELVGLEDAADKLPSELSGGMRKRAAIARAMVLDHQLLFLDEPSSGLDPVTAVELDELILTLNEVVGITVVLVTHELESIFKIVKRCIFLDRDSRSILAEGDPRRLRDETQDPKVRAFFHREARREAEAA